MPRVHAPGAKGDTARVHLEQRNVRFLEVDPDAGARAVRCRRSECGSKAFGVTCRVDGDRIAAAAAVGERLEDVRTKLLRASKPVLVAVDVVDALGSERGGDPGRVHPDAAGTA